MAESPAFPPPPSTPLGGSVGPSGERATGHHGLGVGHHPPGFGHHLPGVGHHQPGVGHHPPGVGHHN
eukprot:SM000266S09842  [mRNA]  locus=s266:2432:2759:- [translate_table: standard]